VLFAYNIGRFVLTLWVVPLRDAETRSAVTPALDDYIRIYTWHRVLAPIGLVAVVIFGVNILHVLEWLLTTRVHTIRLIGNHDALNRWY
jgi:hypothetical protein